MDLESLANELLLDLFEYFNSVHLLRTFHGLNSRFDNLLFAHFQTHCLNFQSAPKHDFDAVCQQNLSSFIDRIILLRLSDDSETPQQIDLFLSRILTLRQFIHLRSLSLCHIRSTATVMKMMIESHHLPSLTHLSINNCYLPFDQIGLADILNNIWHLPKLTNCHLDIYFECESLFVTPIFVSSSLEYLSIEGLDCSYNELARLFQSTPHLRYLHVKVNSTDSDDTKLVPIMMSSLVKLKLSFGGSLDIMRNLLQSMPNLHQLIAEIWSISMSGHQWEEIIVNHLRKLKVLRFKMQFEVETDDNYKEEEVNQLLESFRTRFWLEEHQWYVRCHWNTEDDFKFIHIYTLPYAFFDFPAHEIGILSKSTCPEDHDHWLYGRVHNLHYPDSSFNDLALSRIYFPNLHHLYLRLPVNDQFWTVIPRLNQLKSLVVWMTDYHQLQALLDRAPHLYSIVFASSSTPLVSLTESTSLSVRRLDFQSTNQYFNDQQCIDLSRSSLGCQCEVLRIRVKNRTNIVSLANTMVNLRALSFESEDDKWMRDENSSLSTRDELVEWLQQHLPSTYTITRDVLREIRLWIHRSNDDRCPHTN